TELTGKDIAAAGKLVGTVPEAVAKVRAAIQARLRAAAQPILEKAHALAATMPPHVLAPEWAPVVTAGGAVDAALAPASITAADVTKAQAALDAAQKAAQVARNGAGLRLAREIGAL